jgi:hypothetical protein
MSEIIVGDPPTGSDTSDAIRCSACLAPFTTCSPVTEEQLPLMCEGCGHFGSLRLVIDGVQRGGPNA